MQGGCAHLRFYCVEGCGSYMYAPLLLPAAVQPCVLGVLTLAWAARPWAGAGGWAAEGAGGGVQAAEGPRRPWPLGALDPGTST